MMGGSKEREMGRMWEAARGEKEEVSGECIGMYTVRE
jgi:hypothetical protein